MGLAERRPEADGAVVVDGVEVLSGQAVESGDVETPALPLEVEDGLGVLTVDALTVGTGTSVEPRAPVPALGPSALELEAGDLLDFAVGIVVRPVLGASILFRN